MNRRIGVRPGETPPRHKCVVPWCDCVVPSRFPFCETHLGLLPNDMRALVLAVRPVAPAMSDYPCYAIAAGMAVLCIALRNGRITETAIEQYARSFVEEHCASLESVCEWTAPHFCNRGPDRLIVPLAVGVRAFLPERAPGA